MNTIKQRQTYKNENKKEKKQDNKTLIKYHTHTQEDIKV